MAFKCISISSLQNLTSQTQSTNIVLVNDDRDTSKTLFEVAEISIKLDDNLYNAWNRGGKISSQLIATNDEKKKIIQKNNAIIDNIILNPNEIVSFQLNFNFLTEEITEKNIFNYHIIQKDKDTGNIIGEEAIVISKDLRELFFADAGDTKSVNINEPITINATQIIEPVVYNWYDSIGNLVYTGKDLTVATNVATKYKLEVIATSDGFKDYTEVEIKLKPSFIDLIYPNPTSNVANISYKINEVTSAYLMIISSYGSSYCSNNYILDINNSNINIDLSNYETGFYTVALVCNGQIVDAKTLIKN